MLSALLLLPSFSGGTSAFRDAGPHIDISGVAESGSIEFRNGKWFDGYRFAADTFYSVAGVLTTSRPSKIDGTVDLKGGYVVPPFAEAHTHNVSLPPTEKELEPYINEGIFYVMNQAGLAPEGGQKRRFTDFPIEIAYATIPITPNGGHPVILNQRAVERGNLKLKKEELDGKAYLLIDNVTDLDRKWDGYLQTDEPDFVKVYLGFIDEYEKRSADERYIDKRGVSLAVLKEIVRRAHKVHLRVSAHIEDSADFHACLVAGVDIIAHLPGLRTGEAAGFTNNEPADRWLISRADATLAAKKHTPIVTTAIAAKALLDTKRPDNQLTRRIYISNIEALKRAGARIVIGSDYYQGTALAEAYLLSGQSLLGNGIKPLAAFTNAELLKVWCEDTPVSIFPGRRIGKLKTGYEASFLVLEGDPIADLAQVAKIKLAVKNGRTVFERH